MPSCRGGFASWAPSRRDERKWQGWEGERARAQHTCGADVGIAFVAPGSLLHAYAPSSNLRSNSSTTAFSALVSSGPSARTVSGVPMPAANIITPMMLCAFTSRPLLMSQTVDLKLCTSCTSFADARACKPSLLETTISFSSMVYENPSAAAAGRDFRKFVQRLVGVIEYAQQHRKIQT